MGVTDPLTHSAKCTRVSCSLACFPADTFIVDHRMSTTVRLSIRIPDSRGKKKEKKRGKTRGRGGSKGRIYWSGDAIDQTGPRGRFYLGPLHVTHPDTVENKHVGVRIRLSEIYGFCADGLSLAGSLNGVPPGSTFTRRGHGVIAILTPRPRIPSAFVHSPRIA